jgi:hypothetical protein
MTFPSTPAMPPPAHQAPYLPSPAVRNAAPPPLAPMASPVASKLRPSGFPNLLQSPVGSRSSQSPRSFGFNDEDCDKSGFLKANPKQASYPANIRVKNTFIDVSSSPTAKDGFVRRRLSTCPAGSTADEDIWGSALAETQGDSRIMPTVSSMPNFTQCVAICSLPAAASMPNFAQYVSHESCETPVQLPRRVVSIAEALGGGLGGDQMVPTESVGSALHFEGGCKPCVFFHAKGCVSAAHCQFCHLCEAGAVKKRRKEKRDFMRNGALDRKSVMPIGAGPSQTPVSRSTSGRLSVF